MFKRMQIKMTITYSAILIILLLLVNGTTFFVLDSFNSAQIRDDILKTYNTIEPSEWITPPAMSSDSAYEDGEEYDGDHPQPTGQVQLKTPAVLKSFSFYYLFSSDGKLIKYNVKNPDINQFLLGQYASTQVSTPFSFKWDGEQDVYYVGLKSPIVQNGLVIGQAFVGRDVTLAHTLLFNLLKIMSLTLIIGFLASISLGYYLAGRHIRPIKEGYEAKQRFIADASHELRTPISVIRLSAEVIKGEISEKSGLLFDVTQGIEEEADRMQGLVENMLILARSDAGHLELNKEKVLLEEQLKKALFTLQSHGDEKKITLSFHNNVSLGDQNVTVLCDRQLIFSVMIILIENAIKYTPESGHVQVILESHDRFSIIDNGIGIATTDQDKIFDRFYRADVSRTKETGGHGLGLSIAKEIVEKHHGKILLISQEGVGSTFTVRL